MAPAHKQHNCSKPSLEHQTATAEAHHKQTTGHNAASSLIDELARHIGVLVVFMHS
jgi:hypothetical protein